jgi:hypothetical protein
MTEPAVEEVNEDTPRCDRHGGQWGDDLTCEDCTYENGDPRPLPTGRADQSFVYGHKFGYPPDHVGDQPDDIEMPAIET